MPIGYFSLILHAHLPFVRHPEYPEFLEEDWLYEAITEVYLPLIFIFQNLHESGAKPRLAMNISPPLCEMLADKLLETRYTRHLENLIELARKEVVRTKKDAPEFYEAAQMYVKTLSASLTLWNDKYKRNLINAFRELQEEGVLEIITCGATHGFLPLISTAEAKRAQIEIAVKNYQKHFGRNPRGIWLPECAYENGIEDLLKEAGIEYFVGDSHAILYGEPRPRYGVHTPVVCPNGVAVFARDVETSQQVWSAEVGYPGNAAYREFYRDVGWDLPLDYLKPHLHKDGNRRHLGIKYYRITGRNASGEQKQPYIPAAARQKVIEDAADFVGKRVSQAYKLRETFEGHPPLIVSPYDAELYGHWWFEGPQFLNFLFQELHHKKDVVRAVTPGDFLDARIPIQIQQPSASSWGENGYYKVWLNEANAWMYPYQHDAENKMTALANKFNHPNEIENRVLNQLAREVLLAQSSDWAFLIKTGTAKHYAAKRTADHVTRFNTLHDQLKAGQVDEAFLSECETRDNLLPQIEWRYYL